MRSVVGVLVLVLVGRRRHVWVGGRLVTRVVRLCGVVRPLGVRREGQGVGRRGQMGGELVGRGGHRRPRVVLGVVGAIRLRMPVMWGVSVLGGVVWVLL